MNYFQMGKFLLEFWTIHVSGKSKVHIVICYLWNNAVLYGHMDDLTMNIILPVRSDWLIGHIASPTEPLPVSVCGPPTFMETVYYMD